MRTRRNWIVGILAAAIAGTGLTGCGAGSDDLCDEACTKWDQCNTSYKYVECFAECKIEKWNEDYLDCVRKAACNFNALQACGE